MSKPYDGTNEEAVICLSQHLDFINELESSYETINSSYQTLTELMYKCYRYLKDAEEYATLPESTSYIVGTLTSACYEIRTSKELINRLLKVAQALERK